MSKRVQYALLSLSSAPANGTPLEDRMQQLGASIQACWHGCSASATSPSMVVTACSPTSETGSPQERTAWWSQATIVWMPGPRKGF